MKAVGLGSKLGERNQCGQDHLDSAGHTRCDIAAAMAALLLSNANFVIAEPIEVPKTRLGLAITTAIRPEGDRSGKDYVSYKRIVEVGNLDIVYLIPERYWNGINSHRFEREHS
jgi:hypothetical protein